MLKTNLLIDAMRREKLAWELLSQIEWGSVPDLLAYRGYHLRQEHREAIIAIAKELHTGTILAIRNTFSEIGDHVIGGNTTQRNIIATMCKEIIGLTGEALLVDDTLTLTLVG